MNLNLQSDQKRVRRFIQQRIRDFPVYVNPGPGKDEDPISLATLGYNVGQFGWLALVFDTRSVPDIDGEWTAHIDGEITSLEMPNWSAAVDKLLDGKAVVVTLTDGSKRELMRSDADRIDLLVGAMLRDAMVELRNDNAFAKLPLTAKAVFSIEEINGNWSWPSNAKRRVRCRLADDGLSIGLPVGPTAEERQRRQKEYEAKIEARRDDRRRQKLVEVAAEDALITSRRCPFCDQPCPEYRLTCKHCGQTVGRC